MKKPFYLFILLVLLVISFVSGFRYNQHESNQDESTTESRRILHYVDPMNPANTSTEPGIAPCGMPMEPVYADQGARTGLSPSATPGTVAVNAETQQLIGVKIEEAASTDQMATIRALGRIAPDENRVYALVAATDGWMGEVHDSTTGSMVSKDQLLGKIRIYDYDFFTWQQRYLTELGNAGRRRVFLSPLSGAAERLDKVISKRQQAGELLPDVGGPIALPRDTDYTENKNRDQTPIPADSPSPPKPVSTPSTKEKQPLNKGKQAAPSGIPPGVLYYGDPLGKNVPSAEPAPAPAGGKNQVPELPTGPVPDLPTGPVPDLPTGPAPELPDESASGQSMDMGSELPNKTSPETDGDNSSAMHESMPGMATDASQPSSSPGPMNSPAMSHMEDDHQMEKIPPPAMEHATKPEMVRSPVMKNRPNLPPGGLYFVGEDDILYASKARQELLDLGVGQSQLEQLAESGVYVTSVEMRSPIDGLVLSRNVTTRQKIDRGLELFRIADLKRVWVETDIYDREAQYIQPGTPAWVSLPKLNEKSIARVSEVLPVYDGTSRSLKVRLEMENLDYAFRPDMFVDVEFMLEFTAALSVPSGAVIDSGKHKTVYVVRDEGIFEPRSVITGWQFNDRIEIIKGLDPGEKIVAAGNFLIDSESRMKLSAMRLMDDPGETAGNTQTAVSAIQTMPQLPTVEKKTVQDPVCGMNIDPDEARKAGLVIETDGETYYFCSEECANEFHRHGPQIETPANSTMTPDASSDPEGHGKMQSPAPLGHEGHQP